MMTGKDAAAMDGQEKVKQHEEQSKRWTEAVIPECSSHEQWSPSELGFEAMLWHEGSLLEVKTAEACHDFEIKLKSVALAKEMRPENGCTYATVVD